MVVMVVLLRSDTLPHENSKNVAARPTEWMKLKNNTHLHTPRLGYALLSEQNVKKN